MCPKIERSSTLVWSWFTHGPESRNDEWLDLNFLMSHIHYASVGKQLIRSFDNPIPYPSLVRSCPDWIIFHSFSSCLCACCLLVSLSVKMFVNNRYHFQHPIHGDEATFSGVVDEFIFVKLWIILQDKHVVENTSWNKMWDILTLICISTTK